MTITPAITQLFHVDALAKFIIILVGFIGLVVTSFARRNMYGDAHYSRFFILLGCLLGVITVMVLSDNLVLFLLAWSGSNMLLVKLMVHEAQWNAARASGHLTAKTLAIGFVSIALGFSLLYGITGQISIQAIIHSRLQSPWLIPALLLILLGAMSQSGIWPFHRWLTSSLNSPTTISAVMHAGLVNGGGFLLTRFAPLYLQTPKVLLIIFMLGVVTALLGTAWKLMQGDVKRMLACSTMGQMGFMFVQCGLGLFPAAVAHLGWHGLFKAYAFLGSGSVIYEERLDADYPPRVISFILALVCGAVGSLGFAWMSNKIWLAQDTTLVLTIVAWVAGTQFSLAMLRNKPIKRFLLAFALTTVLGMLYGVSVYVIELSLRPSNMNIMQPQPLNSVHIIGLVLFVLTWFSMIVGRNIHRVHSLPSWLRYLYVKMLNASQPHPSTITAHRNHYQFL